MEIHVTHGNGTEETISREDSLGPVAITVVIPDQTLEADGDDYMVLRVHDGGRGSWIPWKKTAL